MGMRCIDLGWMLALLPISGCCIPLCGTGYLQRWVNVEGTRNYRVVVDHVLW